MKVLICDDDPMTLKALEFQFKKDGYDVVKAANGKDAMQILTDDHDINFLITDLYMPMNSGLELITHVRDTLKSEIPILVLTRSNVEGTIDYAFELGANGYLTKPFKLEEIKYQIERMLEEKRERIERMNKDV